MGIRRLTTFVNNQFTGWKEDPVKGKLIVDGNWLSYALLGPPGERVYGGDYVSIATRLDNFFNTLLKAGINPLVVFDGVTAFKKINVMAQRYKANLENVSQVYYEDDGTEKGTLRPIHNVVSKHVHVKPFLLHNVIVDSVKRTLGDNHLFVADNDADIDIACLAIHHQCPVLSNDGDFYIFPLLYGYIPYSRFYWDNAKNNIIYGDFYSYQAFCKQFEICDPSLLTVIPAIVGNDTITQLDKDNLRIIMPENCYADNPVENAVRYVATFTTFDSCLTSLRRHKLFDMIKSIQGAYHDYFFLPLFKPRNSLATSLRCEDGSPLPEFILKLHRKGLITTSISKVLWVCKIGFGVVLEDVLLESWCRLIGVPIRRVIYGILCGSDVCITETQRCKRKASYEEVEIKVLHKSHMLASKFLYLHYNPVAQG